MKKLIILLFTLYASNSTAGVITCGDAMSVKGDARMALHHSAQKRAQRAVEDFTGKTLTVPYPSMKACFGNKCESDGTPESTASFVDIYWCETNSTPLHSAYYSLYSSSKLWFDKRYAHTQTIRKPIRRKNVSSVSLGTGWPVAGGFVVTNHHVVAGHKKIVLIRQDGVKISGSVAMDDVTNDLVLIRVKDARQLPPALPLATGVAHAGARVFTIGYPHPDFMGSEPKVTDGLISAVTGLGNDPRTYQISVPIQAGNSGGPLLNMKGEVVGITASKLSASKIFKWTGDLPQNVNYAIKIGYLTMLLSSVPSKHHIQVLPTLAGNVEQLAARIEKSVLIVVAE
ncbi:MAG: serine protease [Mariprofundaceae bacterium]|nr:serine protease [Mariprofundaceae bacterium]